MRFYWVLPPPPRSRSRSSIPKPTWMHPNSPHFSGPPRPPRPPHNQVAPPKSLPDRSAGEFKEEETPPRVSMALRVRMA